MWVDQPVGLWCEYGTLVDFLVEPNLSQSEGQFEYISYGNDWLGWNLYKLHQDCHIEA